MAKAEKRSGNYSSQSRVAHYYRGKQAKSLRFRLLVLSPLVVLLALILSDTFFFKLTLQDDSMEPLLTNKKSYWFSSIHLGLIKPFSLNRPENRFGNFEVKIRRGQIVAVNNPLSPPSTIPGNMLRTIFRVATLGFYQGSQDLMTVRRVLALPGETVRIQNKQIFINNQPFTPPWRIAYADNQVLSEKTSGRDSIKEIYVPAQEVFVINDNWMVQNDSREMGTLPFYKIRGTLRGTKN